MLVHNTTSVLFVTEKDNSILNPLISYLTSIPHMKVDTSPCLSDNLDTWKVVVTVGASASSESCRSPAHRRTAFSAAARFGKSGCYFGNGGQIGGKRGVGGGFG